MSGPARRSKPSSHPRIFSIPAGVRFLGALARGIRDEVGDDPLALSRVVVLLPTRRACRALADAFVALEPERPLLLPRLSPLGDVDDDELLLHADDVAGTPAPDLPPAMPELRRRLILARLILAGRDVFGAHTPAAAIELAGELARFIDQVQIEQLSYDKLAELAPADLAQHWQQTLRFLELVTRRWPKVVADEGAIDAAERRNRALTALAEHWRKHPPADPVYAAGSTGSIPATAALLDVIARLPKGRVVLPGLDRHLDDEAWAKLEETHPQYGLAQLLTRL